MALTRWRSATTSASTSAPRARTALPTSRSSATCLARSPVVAADPGRCAGDGADEHSLARLAEQQSLGTQLANRSADNGARHAVLPGHLGSGRNGRADRKLPGRHLLPEIVGDLPVCGAPDEFGHLVVLLSPKQAARLATQARLAAIPRPANYTYHVVHSVLACARTAADCPARARTLRDTHHPRPQRPATTTTTAAPANTPPSTPAGTANPR